MSRFIISGTPQTSAFFTFNTIPAYQDSILLDQQDIEDDDILIGLKRFFFHVSAWEG